MRRAYLENAITVLQGADPIPLAYIVVLVRHLLCCESNTQVRQQLEALLGELGWNGGCVGCFARDVDTGALAKVLHGHYDVLYPIARMLRPRSDPEPITRTKPPYKKGRKCYSSLPPYIYVQTNEKMRLPISLQGAEVLGSGNFGTVYKAIVDGKVVAVKMLQTNNSSEVMGEIAVMTGLRHQYVLDIIGWNQLAEEGQIAIAMPYMVSSLHCQVSGKPWAAKACLPLLKKLCLGIHYLHSRTPSIIHRDLKCQNILLDHDGNPKVADFGISHIKSRGAATGGSYGAEGCRYWCAPEVLLAELIPSTPMDATLDIFSLAIVIWEMLTGLDPREISLEDLLAGKRLPLNSITGDDLPTKRCWATSPCDRPSISMILDELDLIGGFSPNLFESAQRERLDLLERLLAQPEIAAMVNDRDFFKRTALNYVARQGNAACIELLLKYGAHLNAPGNFGATPLHSASRNGHQSLVKFLLSRPGIEVNIDDDFKWPPLYWAVLNGHHEIVHLLLERKADIRTVHDATVPLHWLWSYGVDAVFKYTGERSIPDWSLLHWACFNKHPGVVRVLLDEYKRRNLGFLVNEQTSKQFTPLHLACFVVHAETATQAEVIVRLLLGSGAQVTKDFQGKTPSQLSLAHIDKDLLQSVNNARLNSETELLDYYTPDQKPLGTALRTIIHREGLWHKVVHVWICNSKRELLIQRRRDDKESFSGLWDASAAGHIQAGKDAVATEEELGLPLTKDCVTHLFSTTYEFVLQGGAYINREIAEVYVSTGDVDIDQLKMQDSEVAEIKWIPWQELQARLEQKDPFFLPFYNLAYAQLFTWVQHASLLP